MLDKSLGHSLGNHQKCNNRKNSDHTNCHVVAHGMFLV